MIYHAHDLGLIDYQQAWDLQARFAAEIARGERPPTLLLLEHPHTYTVGRRGHSENLLWDEQTRTRRGLSVYWVDRGGDVTYHGPGQLVGYPLFPLGALDSSKRLPQADYVGYVRKLESALIVALSGLGLAAAQRTGLTGVWVQADVASRCPRCKPEDRQKPAKIAAIGVKVDANGVSRHGFALNVNPNMRYFDGIVPCGLADHPVISLADLFTPPPSMEEVKRRVVAAFEEVFDCEMSPLGV